MSIPEVIKQKRPTQFGAVEIRCIGGHYYTYLFSAFLAKGTDGVMKIEVLSLFLLFSIPDIFFLQGRHTTEHVEVSGGAV